MVFSSASQHFFMYSMSCFFSSTSSQLCFPPTKFAAAVSSGPIIRVPSPLVETAKIDCSSCAPCAPPAGLVRHETGQAADTVITPDHFLWAVLPTGRRMTRPVSLSMVDRNGRVRIFLRPPLLPRVIGRSRSARRGSRGSTPRSPGPARACLAPRPSRPGFPPKNPASGLAGRRS